VLCSALGAPSVRYLARAHVELLHRALCSSSMRVVQPLHARCAAPPSRTMRPLGGLGVCRAHGGAVVRLHVGRARSPGAGRASDVLWTAPGRVGSAVPSVM
jgi:hypothetical protein